MRCFLDSSEVHWIFSGDMGEAMHTLLPVNAYVVYSSSRENHQNPACSCLRSRAHRNFYSCYSSMPKLQIG